ncbi:xanthine dehydrogenase family protein molybdopterin-binding subunit [Streptomyces longwoodensis]|uniref:xanthine dehydrogenase family protein molybdopterin-binding subunit n=1 Tax=Streptomyces longwoodensis TaxID=68231 RepID=UPI0033F0453B
MSDGPGTSPTRPQDRAPLDGSARYVADLELPGALSAYFVRSPLAHADIVSIDTSAAEAAPGVVAVFTGRDLAGTVEPLKVACPLEGYVTPAFHALPTDRVRFQGDLVALVVARDPYLAEDAADLVAVTYRSLPVVTDARATARGEGPVLFDDTASNVLYREEHRYGDVAGAFADAHQVVRHVLRQERCQNSPLEPRGGVACFDAATGALTYDVASQSPHAHRVFLAEVLGLDVERIRVRTPRDMGGSFGIKGGVYREDVAVCWAAMRLGRPVRWIEDRRDHLTAAGQARGESVEIEVALDRAGRMTGLRADLMIDQGAYPVPPIASAVFASIVRCLLPNCYAVGAYEFTGRLVLTNRCPYVAYRGPWEMATFAAERTADLVARALGEEPAHYRLRSLVAVDGPDPRTVTGVSLRDIPQLGRTLREAVGRADLGAFRARQEHARRSGRLLGFGVATLLEPAPGPWSLAEAVGSHMGPEPVRLVMDANGRVTVLTAQIPHGQGHATTLAQVAAGELGLPLERVDVVHGDTQLVPFSLAGTGASRGAALAGGAVLRAARRMRAALLRVAAGDAGDPDRLGLRDGRVVSLADGSTVAPVAVVAARCHATAAGAAALDVSEVFDGAETGWAEATHCCWVEVDPALGTVAVDRYLVVADSGRLINPAVVDGQVRGGVAQGVGTVLSERSQYAADGRQLSVTLADYLLPTALSNPSVEVVHVETERPGDVPFRGIGEGPAVLAPSAVTAAVEDALAHLGVRVTSRFLPPWRVLDMMEEEK